MKNSILDREEYLERMATAFMQWPNNEIMLPQQDLQQAPITLVEVIAAVDAVKKEQLQNKEETP